MSVECITWSIKQTELGSTEKLLLVLLSNYANADYVAWASERHLAKLCNCSPRTIRRSLKILTDKNYIEVIRKFDKGRQTINDYKILLDNIKEDSRTPVSTSSRTPVSTLNTKIKIQYSKAFGQFWNIYPRKVNKWSAEVKWEKMCKEYSAEKIIKATELFKEKMNTTEEKFIPYPSTYLNKRMFLDVEVVANLRKDAIAG